MLDHRDDGPGPLHGVIPVVHVGTVIYNDRTDDFLRFRRTVFTLEIVEETQAYIQTLHPRTRTLVELLAIPGTWYISGIL